MGSRKLIMAVGLALLVIAGLVRLPTLGQRSLWVDETISWGTANHDQFGEVVKATVFWVDQAPLFYLTEWALRPFGLTEVALRLPSALAGSISVLVILCLGLAMFGGRVAFIAGLITALSSYTVWYSQDARPYALLMLLASLQMLFVYRIATTPGAWDWIGFAVSSITAIYIHYVAFLSLLAAIVYLVSVWLTARTGGLTEGDMGSRSLLSVLHPLLRWLVLLGVLAVIAVAYSPWWGNFQVFLQKGRQSHMSGVPPGTQIGIGTVETFLASFGLTGFALVPMALGLGVGLVRLCSARGTRDRRLALGLLLVWQFVPIALIAAQLGAGLLFVWARYLIFLYPATVLMLALGWDLIVVVLGPIVSMAAQRVRLLYGTGGTSRGHVNLRSEGVAMGAVVVFLGATLMQSLIMSLGMQKDDYRDAATTIASAHRPAVVLAMGAYPNYVTTAIPYYSDRLRAPITVVDAALLEQLGGAGIFQQDVAVWGAVTSAADPDRLRITGYLAYGPRHTRLDSVRTAGYTLHRFQGIVLVEPMDRASPPLSQAIALLRWGADFEPSLQIIAQHLASSH